MPARYKLLLGVVGLVVLTDQITKTLVDKSMAIYATRPLIPGLLDLHYIRNTGAAFGFLSGSHSAFRIPFFIVVSLFAIGIILYLFRKMEESEQVVPLALSLVLGGAIGNLIDRVRLGEVIDFIYAHYRRFAWPAFNVADITITVGVILLILRMFVFQGRASREASRPDNQPDARP
jgi:signal peptidase II